MIGSWVTLIQAMTSFSKSVTSLVGRKPELRFDDNVTHSVTVRRGRDAAHNDACNNLCRGSPVSAVAVAALHGTEAGRKRRARTTLQRRLHAACDDDCDASDDAETFRANLRFSNSGKLPNPSRNSGRSKPIQHPRADVHRVRPDLVSADTAKPADHRAGLRRRVRGAAKLLRLPFSAFSSRTDHSSSSGLRISAGHRVKDFIFRI